MPSGAHRISADRPCFRGSNSLVHVATATVPLVVRRHQVLVGADRPGLRSLPCDAPGRQPAGLRRPRQYNEYSHMLTQNPLIYLARSGWSRCSSSTSSRPCDVTLRNRDARGRSATQQEAGRRHQPEVAGLVDDDRHGHRLLLFVVIHLKTFKFGPVPRRPARRCATCIGWCIEVFREPLLRRLLRPQHGASSACTCGTASRARSSRWA